MRKKFCAALLLMLLLPACALAEVVISEIMTSNGTYENGHAYDWIEPVSYTHLTLPTT